MGLNWSQICDNSKLLHCLSVELGVMYNSIQSSNQCVCKKLLVCNRLNPSAIFGVEAWCYYTAISFLLVFLSDAWKHPNPPPPSSQLLCFMSVRAYNQRPDLCICNCKQPSCLDEQVCMTVKWIRFSGFQVFSLRLSPHPHLSCQDSYSHFEVLVLAFLLFILSVLS